eukprot:symbB.v1.2.042640.t1/scaffold10602.1/size1594/1
MKQRVHDAEAVAKQLADEMNIAKAQVASLWTTSQKILEGMRNEFALKEEHLRKKLEADILAQSHTIGILKTKVATQTNELAEEKAKFNESNEKHRSMYNDIQAMRNEMRENQNLKEWLLDSQMETRRLRAELDAVPKRSPEREPRGSQGPMPEEHEPQRGGAFPWETPQNDRNEQGSKPREEIRASSDKPDEAWEWLMEVYQDWEDARRLLQELSNPRQFVTLDTKILAQLSRVAKGALGAQILNLKEVEAASGRVARGRQVLFMFDQYFRTNEEAGVLYGTEDLLKIHLINDDLATFIRNWDAVIAGMKHMPDNNTLKDIFMGEIRKTKRLEY